MISSKKKKKITVELGLMQFELLVSR